MSTKYLASYIIYYSISSLGRSIISFCILLLKCVAFKELLCKWSTILSPTSIRNFNKARKCQLFTVLSVFSFRSDPESLTIYTQSLRWYKSLWFSNHCRRFTGYRKIIVFPNTSGIMVFFHEHTMPFIVQIHFLMVFWLVFLMSLKTFSCSTFDKKCNTCSRNHGLYGR